MFPFRTSLNASTLFPFRLSVPEQVRVAAEAGYDGIELWVKDIEAELDAGRTVSSLRRDIDAAGVNVVNAIAFFAWADADPAVRDRAFAQARREMETLAALGCAAVAAPPFGDVEGVPLEAFAERFAALVELGRSFGVEPLLEFWGRAKRLSKVGEALFVAAESGVPDAKLLLDPFHMYTGGSALSSLRYVKGENIGIVHANDYPSAPGRSAIADKDRVFPGEGIAPSAELARLLYAAGYRGYLSLELFIDDFAGKSASDVAAHGLACMKRAYAVEVERT